MKSLLIAVVAVSLLLIAPARVQCQSCGAPPAPPAPPAGCRALRAQCVVDTKGHAGWIFVCVPN